jgi:iron complex outermembrane receptor protein
MSVKSSSSSVRYAVLVALAAAAPGAAIAAEDGSEATTGAQRERVEEIVVTARKQEENLQTAPLSVSAVSSATLEQQNIVRLDRMSDLVPNLDVAVTPGSSTAANTYIRGIGTFDFSVLIDPPVATYIDGVLYPRPNAQLVELVDLERIEVLRGPQGTLFGRNTTGGAINIITKAPSDEFRIEQKLGYGTDDEFVSRTVVDTGEWGGSGIKAKFAYNHHERDGWVRDLNRNDAHSPGALNSNSLWIGIDGPLGSIGSFSYRYDNTDMHARQALSQTAYMFPDVQAYFSQSEQFGGDPFIISPDPIDEVYISSAPDDHYEQYGHGLTLNFELGENTTLRNIAAYRELRENPAPIPITGQGNLRGPVLDALGNVVIAPVSPFDIAGAAPNSRNSPGNIETQHQVSDELQLLGSTDNFNYVAGLFWFNEKGNLFNPNFFTFVLPGGQLGVNLTSTRQATLETTSYAAYTQVSWRPPALDDKLELTGGVRYTHDEKEIDENSLFNGAPSLTRKDSDSWSNVSGLVSASYQWTDDIMGYARVSTAYRAGGYSATNVGSFDPEKAIAYELGLKSELFDQRLRLNAALFRTDYKDLQVQQQVQGLPRVSNAGKANYTGGELELVAIPAEGWQLEGNVGYVDPKYEQYEFIDENGNTLDLADEARFNGVSKLNYNLAAQYSVGLGSLGELTARVDWSWRDKKYWTPLDRTAPFNEQIAADSYGKLGARLILDEVRLRDVNLRFELWGENLLDEEIRTAGNDFGTLGIGTVNYGRMRTVGINVTAEL